MSRADPGERSTRKVDVTPLEENLRLSVEGAFLELIELQRFAREQRRAREEAASQ